MPYIGQLKRDMMEQSIHRLAQAIDSEGELNYAITKLILALDPASYREYAGVIGTLELVKQELIRRRVNPYEDAKIKENGDIKEFNQKP